MNKQSISAVAAAIGLAFSAGAMAEAMSKSEYKSQKDGIAVEYKGEEGPVTRADREANDLIVEGLGRAFPHDGILSEEIPDDRAWQACQRVRCSVANGPKRTTFACCEVFAF